MAIQTASSITAFTPGTKLFAPQVRLVKQDGAPLTIGEVAINEDVISISITQVCNNVGQAEITLNNQRFDGFRPVTPIWRYNKLDPKETSFGTRLRIDLRYGNDPWTPMMLVRVTELSFTFPSTTAGVLVLKGEDLLSMLKTRRAEPKKHEKLHEIDIVESTVNDSGCGLSIAPFSPRNMFATPLATLTHEDGKTNLQFIQEIAERMDHEVYVEFEKPGEPLSADKDGKSAAVELVPKMYFRPSRSGTLGDPVTLIWSVDIIDFKPTIKVMETLTAVKVAGNEPNKRGSVDKLVPESPSGASALVNDLHTATGGKKPFHAVALRGRAVETEVASRTSASRGQLEKNVGSVQATNCDKQRAEMHATAVFRKSQREFLTAEVTVIGIAGLRPGIHVNLTKLEAPFDGIYYVTQALHTLSASGYITKLSLRRPGMLDPADYPDGKK